MFLFSDSIRLFPFAEASWHDMLPLKQKDLNGCIVRFLPIQCFCEWFSLFLPLFHISLKYILSCKRLFSHFEGLNHADAYTNKTRIPYSAHSWMNLWFVLFNDCSHVFNTMAHIHENILLMIIIIIIGRSNDRWVKMREKTNAQNTEQNKNPSRVY